MEINIRKKRIFVPEDINLDSWDDIASLFRLLLKEDIHTEADAEKWIRKMNELRAVLYQEKTMRYIHFTCRTDNPDRARRYQYFCREIEPRYKKEFQKLHYKLSQIPCREQMMHGEYSRYFGKNVQKNRKVLHSRDLHLKVEENELKAAYQRLTSKISISYKGKKLTRHEISEYLRSPDRNVRKEVWELETAQWMQIQDEVEDIFSRLLHLRTQLAVRTGFADYMEYLFHAQKRVDCGPQDCISFHVLCKKHIVPLLESIQEERKAKLGITVLKPFDLFCDEDGLEPLKPFQHVEELVEKSRMVFSRLDPRLGAYFETLRRSGLMDLDSRQGKAPGSYCVNLKESGLPFIFMNATGTQQDVITLLHEAGHAFHYLAMTNSSHTSPPPLEMSELVALGMESMGVNHLDVFYNDADDTLRAGKQYFQKMITHLTGIAHINSFEQWVYTHPDHSVGDRREYWASLQHEYGGLVDYSNELLKTTYHQTSLMFKAPFYFITYAFAYAGALQLLNIYQNNKQRCVDNYWNALYLGGSDRLRNLYRAAGVEFGFPEDFIVQSIKNITNKIF